MEHYILAGHTPIKVSFSRWFCWFCSTVTSPDERRVAKTEVGEAVVSTVFLGLDHRQSLHGEPVLFETMVFGGEHSGKQERYSTWGEAEVGHEETVKLVKGEMTGVGEA